MPPTPPAAPSRTSTRERIHAAAMSLFTKQGFHGTGMREIAKVAGVSLGNVYNYHATKQELFGAICDEFEEAYTGPDTPISKALDAFRSIADLESLGEASQRTVREFADYIRLIYVDVVELEGEHIRRLFGGLRQRYEARLGDRLRALQASGELSADADPVSAIMTATITYFYLFNVEYVFGVKRPFGVSTKDMIGSVADLLRDGLRPR